MARVLTPIFFYYNLISVLYPMVRQGTEKFLPSKSFFSLYSSNDTFKFGSSQINPHQRIKFPDYEFSLLLRLDPEQLIVLGRGTSTYQRQMCLFHPPNSTHPRNLKKCDMFMCPSPFHFHHKQYLYKSLDGVSCTPLRDLSDILRFDMFGSQLSRLSSTACTLSSVKLAAQMIFFCRRRILSSLNHMIGFD